MNCAELVASDEIQFQPLFGRAPEGSNAHSNSLRQTCSTVELPYSLPAIPIEIEHGSLVDRSMRGKNESCFRRAYVKLAVRGLRSPQHHPHVYIASHCTYIAESKSTLYLLFKLARSRWRGELSTCASSGPLTSLYTSRYFSS